jgi:hypothetical protein
MTSFAKILQVIVAPYAGAWIEIYLTKEYGEKSMSHPTRVRGLKFLPNIMPDIAILSRTLRGCVD